MEQIIISAVDRHGVTLYHDNQCIDALGMGVRERAAVHESGMTVGQTVSRLREKWAGLTGWKLMQITEARQVCPQCNRVVKNGEAKDDAGLAGENDERVMCNACAPKPEVVHQPQPEKTPEEQAKETGKALDDEVMVVNKELPEKLKEAWIKAKSKRSLFEFCGVVDVKNIGKQTLNENSLSVKPEEGVQQTFKQYVLNGNRFMPVGEVCLKPVLQPFGYRIVSTMEGVRFEKVKPKTDELYQFEGSVTEKVAKEIAKFWTLKENYKKLGLMMRRGIIVEGAAGTGKSSLFQQVAENMTAQGDIVFFARDVGSLIEGLKIFRDIEPERRAVVIFEDLDECIKYDQQRLLQLLDGDTMCEHILYLASTNYIEQFPPRLRRPGRFDKVIHLGPPPVEGRLTYLTHKLGANETPERIREIAEKTDGLSFGHLRELIVGVYALQESLDDVIARLRDGITAPKDEPMKAGRFLSTNDLNKYAASEPAERAPCGVKESKSLNESKKEKLKESRHPITVNQVSDNEWDVSRGDVDFNIRQEGKKFEISAFDSGNSDPDSAFLDSTEARTFDEALAICQDFCGTFTPDINSLSFGIKESDKPYANATDELDQALVMFPLAGTRSGAACENALASTQSAINALQVGDTQEAITHIQQALNALPEGVGTSDLIAVRLERALEMLQRPSEFMSESAGETEPTDDTSVSTPDDAEGDDGVSEVEESRKSFADMSDDEIRKTPEYFKEKRAAYERMRGNMDGARADAIAIKKVRAMSVKESASTADAIDLIAQLEAQDANPSAADDEKSALKSELIKRAQTKMDEDKDWAAQASVETPAAYDMLHAFIQGEAEKIVGKQNESRVNEISPPQERVELPDACFAVVPSSGRLMKIKKGESGYYPYVDNATGLPVTKPKFGKTMEEFCDILNAKLGITKGQQEAMMAGSMFGWDIPGADPNNYNDDGSMKLKGGRMKESAADDFKSVRRDEDSSIEHQKHTITQSGHGVVEPGSPAEFYEQEAGRPPMKWWPESCDKCGTVRRDYSYYGSRKRPFVCGDCSAKK